MLKSMENLEKVMSGSIVELLNYETKENLNLRLMERFPNINLPLSKDLFYVDDDTNIYFVVYNSYGQSRREGKLFE